MKLEHTNIVVADLAASRAFLEAALPHCRVRGEGESTGSEGAKHWLHIGSDSNYLTFNQLHQPSSSTGAELAHLGIEVEDLDSVIERLSIAGYPVETLSAPHPYRKSAYFLDANAVQYEFVEYLSERPEERNLYGSETGSLKHPARDTSASTAQLLQQLYAVVDTRDSGALSDFLHPDVRFRIGNHDWIEGRESVLAANAGFFASIAEMQHTLDHMHSHRGCTVCCGEVSYRRLDGSRLQDIPFTTLLRLQEGLIVHYQVYVDISPL